RRAHRKPVPEHVQLGPGQREHLDDAAELERAQLIVRQRRDEVILHGAMLPAYGVHASIIEPPDSPRCAYRRITMPSNVTAVPPAAAPAALAHFESAFQFETDCWDVHDAMSRGAADFVVLDV